MNLSFAGCGFLGIYHVGVAVCLKQYAPQLLLNKISGASAGAIAACALLCDLPLGEITSDVLRVVTEARANTLGPFSPSFNVQNILLEGLQKVIPDDAHERVSGKLHISLTRVYDGKNVIVSQFNSKEDILQALQASSFIPFFSGLLPPSLNGVRYMDGGFSDNLPLLDENTITVSPFCGESDICPCDPSYQLLHALLASSFIPIFSGWIPPRFHGVRYIDGCYSDNLPILDENTITVSPFCGESDICPRDDTYNVLQVNLANTSIELSRQNIYRFTRILFPPNPEVLSNMCKQGFDDALRFLHRNNLINCTRCLAVQSTYTTVTDSVEEHFDYDPNCHECKQQRQEALVANLPEFVLTVFQDAINSTNKGVMNWLLKHRSVKLLSILTLPCIIPADIVCATVSNLRPTKRRHVLRVTMWRGPIDVRGYGHYDCWAQQHKDYYSHRCHRSLYRENATYSMKLQRILANAPHLGSNLKQVTQFVMDNLSQLLSRVNHKREQLTTQISCRLAITEYRGTKYDTESILDIPAPKHNEINFNFSLDVEKDELPIDRNSALELQNKMLSQASRRSSSLSIVNSQAEKCAVDEDTFDHILQVTAHHDALMAFYYLDENKRMKVTEIFDVTDADTGALLSPDEREANRELEFDDNEWDTPQFQADSWNGLSKLGNEECEDDSPSISPSELSLQDAMDICDSSNIFSDPESEWLPDNSGLVSPLQPEKVCADLRPESDQSKCAKKQGFSYASL